MALNHRGEKTNRKIHVSLTILFAGPATLKAVAVAAPAGSIRCLFDYTSSMLVKIRSVWRLCRTSKTTRYCCSGADPGPKYEERVQIEATRKNAGRVVYKSNH